MDEVTGEGKEGGGVSLISDLDQCLSLSAVWVSQQAEQSTFRDHKEDFLILDVHNQYKDEELDLQSYLVTAWTWMLSHYSWQIRVFEHAVVSPVPLTQLFVSSHRSFLDAAPLPRWPQAERRKDSTCPSTWALLSGWRLGYLYLAEFQVRDVMKKVSKDGLWFHLYSIFKPNISQETVSTENAW